MANMNALPSDPASALADAQRARQRLSGGLRLPSWFHTSLGVAVAAQVGAAAYGLAEQGAVGMLVLVAGCLVFLAVAAVQVARFRRLNGVRVDGLVSRAILGTSTVSSVLYAAGLAAAVWAALAGPPALAAVAAAATGAGYAAAAHLWWRGYLRDPAGHARGESRTTLALWGLAAVAGLVALVVAR